MISDVMQCQIKNLFGSVQTDATGDYSFATLDVDSTMTVYEQLSYCKKIQ